MNRHLEKCEKCDRDNSVLYMAIRRNIGSTSGMKNLWVPKETFIANPGTYLEETLVILLLIT